LHRRAVAHDEVEVPFLREAVAELVHLRKLLAGVDMHDRERDVAEERLARQPQHDVGILAQRPQHGDRLQAAEGLAQDVDALVFERVEVAHMPSPSVNPKWMPHSVFPLRDQRRARLSSPSRMRRVQGAQPIEAKPSSNSGCRGSLKSLNAWLICASLQPASGLILILPSLTSAIGSAARSLVWKRLRPV